VLRLIDGGLSNREIAAKLVIAVGTVKYYTNQIYSKLGMHSRSQALARARELKLLSCPFCSGSCSEQVQACL
jgi:LuxR family maltose regulon positive regulatory protein